MKTFMVINIGNRGTFPNIVHDASAPFAVVEYEDGFKRHAIRCIISRHATMRGAQIASGKAKARLARGG